MVKGRSILFFLALVCIFTNLSFVSAVTNVTDCMNLTNGTETYQLNTSISLVNASCININNNSIVLDCQGYSISLNSSDESEWFAVGTSHYDNITVKNCIFLQNFTGPTGEDSEQNSVLFLNSSNSIVFNNTFGAAGFEGAGILLTNQSLNFSITNNTMNYTSTSSPITALFGSNIGVMDNNNITTIHGAINLEDSLEINISSNTLVSSATSEPVIILFNSSESIVDSNTITTSGDEGTGIYVTENSESVLLFNNTITTTAADASGIYLEEINNANLTSNIVTTSGDEAIGLNLRGSNSSVVVQNTIKTGGSDTCTVYVYEAENNTFYDNIFNTSSVDGNGFCAGTPSLVNSWNTTEVVVTNIVGGPNIGGNFWANNESTGYSETCTDADGDYFCDDFYNLAGSESSDTNNIDYLPLTNNTNSVSECSSLSTTNKIYYLNQSITGISGTCFNITANNITLDFNGFSITGNTTGYGINITGYNDTTVLDGLIYNFSAGIYLRSNQNNSITNMTLSNNSLYGVEFFASSNNTLTTIIINNNTDFGVYLNGSSSNAFTDFNVSYSGIHINASSINTFTNFNINNSITDAIVLAEITSSNNNFTNVVMINTSSSKYDINFNTEGINGTWISGINFANYTFTGAGGLVNFKEPSFGEIEFTEPINGSGISLADGVDIEEEWVFVGSSVNSGLNKSANISFYSVSFTDPKPQYSSDNIAWTDCSATTNPACVEFSYAVGGNFKFNVSHFTYFRIIEGYSAPATTDDSGGGPSGVVGMTYTIDENQFNQGYTKDLNVNDKIKFSVGGEYHYVKIVEVTANTIKINVLSDEAQEANLLIGDVRRFEINGDSNYDLTVTLNSINDEEDSAEIVVKVNNEGVTEETISEELAKEENALGVISEEKEEKSDEENALEWNLPWAWIIVGFIVLIVIVAALSSVKDKKKKR